MRQVARKGLITIAAAGGVLAAVGGYAHADSGASGGAAHSPGVASGNNVQAPVDVEVNACGNSINVVGLLNPTFGNKCANDGGGKHRGPQGGDHHDHHGKSGKHRGGDSGRHGAGASGHTAHSPGVASGNNVQAPVNLSVNACGNSVDVVGLLNPAFDNDCGDGSSTLPPTGPDYPQDRDGHHPPKAEQPGNPEQPSDSGQPSAPEHRNGPGTSGMRPQAESEPRSEIVTTPAAPKTEAEGGGQLAHTGAGTIGYAVPMSAGLLLGGAVIYRRARSARR
ncbi:chaplin [Streptomyces sp. NPDC050636]|uniref:chaplin n=1 Tax=Streptomyces sp. NPDC050636 TaxID=3154510 RepID=UPI0034414294